MFIITSCLIRSARWPGVYTPEQRYEQTLETIKSIRTKVPDAFIVLADNSKHTLGGDALEFLKSNVNLVLLTSERDQSQELTRNGLQSPAEAVLTVQLLSTLQQIIPDYHSYDRIFKITGRMRLSEGFDISHYENLKGKYVFKKRRPTWMANRIHNVTHNVETRLYSFCPSLTGEFIEMIKKVFPLMPQIDLEHAFFLGLDKEKLVEFEPIYCEGNVASTGAWVSD
jgi:hypothetical protein